MASLDKKIYANPLKALLSDEPHLCVPNPTEVDLLCVFFGFFCRFTVVIPIGQKLISAEEKRTLPFASEEVLVVLLTAEEKEGNWGCESCFYFEFTHTATLKNV